MESESHISGIYTTLAEEIVAAGRSVVECEYLMMPDGPDEADYGDGEEKDATGRYSPDDGERFYLV